MSNEIIAVALEGKNIAEKKTALVLNATPEAKMALVNEKGAAGRKNRETMEVMGIELAIKRACSGSYRSIGEILATKLETPVTIAGRRGFESLKSIFEYEILKMESTPSKGLKKDGTPTPKRKKLEWAITFMANVYAKVDAHHAQRAAEREAAKTQQAQIENQ